MEDAAGTQRVYDGCAASCQHTQCDHWQLVLRVSQIILKRRGGRADLATFIGKYNPYYSAQ